MRALTIAYILLACTVAGFSQTTATYDNVRARQQLTLNGHTLTSVLQTIDSLSTHAQGVTAKAVYDYIATKYSTVSAGTGIDVVKAGSNYTISLDTLKRLHFRTDSTYSGGIGTMRWNLTDGTLDLGLLGGNVTLQLGQESVQRVKHADNSGLVQGRVVYLVGSDGTNPTVRYARANTDLTSANTFGVMTEDATGGSKAFCTTFGLVRNINTNNLTEGGLVWLSKDTAGAMTAVRPTAPNHGVEIGFCIRKHATQGVVFVTVQNGYELNELHDVYAPSPSNNQGLLWKSANLRWEAAIVDTSMTNEGILGVGAGTSTTSVITSNTVASTGVTLAAGTGMTISETTSSNGGSITLTNSSPDQTVSISNGGGIGVTGTYPSFTLTATDQSVTNEIQRLDTFSLSGQTLRASLLNDGVAASSITLPIVDVVAGTNVTVTKSNGVATVSATGGGGGGGTVTGTGVAGRAAFWGSTSAISSDANFAWDSTAIQLNIGSPSAPTGKLNVKGGGATSSTVNLRLTNSGNTEILKVTDDGELTVFKPLTASGRVATFYGYQAPQQLEASIEVGMQSSNDGIAILGGSNISANRGGFIQTKNATTRSISFNGIGAVKVCGSQILATDYTGLSVGASTNIGSNVPTTEGVVFRTISGTMTSGGGNANNFNQSSFGQITVNRQVLATTYTDAANVYIAGPPIQGTATLTNRFSLFVASGNSYFAENIGVGQKIASARLHVQGSNNTSDTYSFIATNSGGSTTTPAICAQNNQKVGIGTNSVDSGATLEVDGTTGGILFPRLTTTERDALTPVNGLMIYNTTTSKFQGYAGGAWVDLH